MADTTTCANRGNQYGRKFVTIEFRTFRPIQNLVRCEACGWSRTYIEADHAIVAANAHDDAHDQGANHAE